ncbi:MAG: FAD-dependent monooxygenase [Polyangiaceae bacterium]
MDNQNKPERIAIVGGGPAGLYFAILTKKRDPRAEVVVFERNKPDDTFGFGVVFSDKTLEGLAEIDAESYSGIVERFFHWDAIDIHVGDTVERSVGHGFSGIARTALLAVLQERARSLGVDVRYETAVEPGSAALAGWDLVVVADGVNSAFRAAFAEGFKPAISFRPNRFVWLGTTFPFEAFTFYFKETEWGLFQVHAYRYEDARPTGGAPGLPATGRSTFIVECSDETYKRTGLAEQDEVATARFFEKIFEKELLDARGTRHPLLVNRSIWRQFPVIQNAKYHHENMVILGDAAHTAHFSIGSGTKLALEDAVALRAALDRGGPLQDALAAYDRDRRPVADSLQRAAQVSLEWFENTERHIKKKPLVFAFSLLTRSLRVTHENLKLRDPAFVARVDEDFAATHSSASSASHKTSTPPMFVPLRLRELELENRVGVSSMCMYSAADGTVDDFHLVHLGSRALGGAGLVMTEMTDVHPDGRITPGCAGMYAPHHVRAWRRVVEFVHRSSTAKIGMQLGHAGRKGSTLPPWAGQDIALPDEDSWPLVAPSSLPWLSASGQPNSPPNSTPRAMTRADMDRVRDDFVRSAEMAREAGFDMLELHCAHGYLLATFLSPLTNVRDDEYGGSIENRARFPLEVFHAIRNVWPAELPISVRISASDWADGGISVGDVVTLGKLFKDAGCDLLDVSTGGTVAHQRPRYGRLFQVPFAELVRSEARIATAAVGGITSYADVNSILAARRADLCLIARAHLFDPYWVRHAAQAQRYELPWPKPYGVLRGYEPRFA